MSNVSARGGVPNVLLATVTTASTLMGFGGSSNYVKIVASNPALVYFNADDAKAQNGKCISVGGSSGPWEGPAGVAQIWAQAVSGTVQMTVVAFMRPG